MIADNLLASAKIEFISVINEKLQQFFIISRVKTKPDILPLMEAMTIDMLCTSPAFFADLMFACILPIFFLPVFFNMDSRIESCLVCTWGLSQFYSNQLQNSHLRYSNIANAHDKFV
jgi:hypothetical protein